MSRCWCNNAVRLLKRGTDIAVRGLQAHIDGQARTGQTASDARRPSDKLSLLVKAAARLAAEQARQELELAGAMFETAQWALSSKAADSLAQMAARQAKGDGALAGLVRERQDLAGEWQARDKLLIAAIAQSPDQRNATTEQALRDRIAKRWFECSGCNCRSRILCGPRFCCTHGGGGVAALMAG